jgi:hypothetical protein
VSSPSEDSELSLLQRAAEFMREVRLTQAQRGKTLSGRHWLGSKQQDAIAQATQSSALIAAVSESAQVNGQMNFLAEQFEEMCRRQGAVVEAELRPAVLKLLAAELFINQNALKGDAKEFIPVTVCQGAIGPELEKEFEGFRNTPSVYGIAARDHASDPRAFLREVEKNRETLAKEPEFKRFRNTPGVFTTAAVCHPRNPRAYLRKAAKDPEGWRAAVMEGREDTTTAEDLQKS